MFRVSRILYKNKDFLLKFLEYQTIGINLNMCYVQFKIDIIDFELSLTSLGLQ